MKVFVVGAKNRVSSEGNLFKSMGHDVTNDFEEANIVVFRGGEDINPAIYGEKIITGTFFNPDRDDYEIDFLDRCTEDQIVVGICRGAQLINARYGGSLWQDVDNHSGTTHNNYILNKDLVKKYGKDMVMLNSLHHQMIRKPAPTFEVLVATNISKKKKAEKQEVYRDLYDIEVAWSKDYKALLFQSHPEFGHGDTTDFFKTTFDFCMETL